MSAMMYPACVITMALGITLFLIIKVVPTFKGIFDQLGGDLPMPTQILLAISDFARTNFLLGVIIVVAIGFGFGKLIKTEYGKRKADQICLKMPIFGELISKIAVAKFCRTFSTLVASGVPILQALDIVGATSGNKVIEDAVLMAKKQVQAGETISDPLARSNAFPPMVIRMIAIGEKTGKLQEMLTKIAKFYESEVNAAIDGLTSMIEPLIIGILGLLIGGIVIALFLPIMKITQMVAGH
jgi:type IV pilus assembly protein PilC